VDAYDVAMTKALKRVYIPPDIRAEMEKCRKKRLDEQAATLIADQKRETTLPKK